MKDGLETTHEITKLIKFSPKRETIFRAFKQENDLESNSSSELESCVLPDGLFVQILCPAFWKITLHLYTHGVKPSVQQGIRKVKHEYMEFRLR